MDIGNGNGTNCGIDYTPGNSTGMDRDTWLQHWQTLKWHYQSGITTGPDINTDKDIGTHTSTDLDTDTDTDTGNDTDPGPGPGPRCADLDLYWHGHWH